MEDRRQLLSPFDASATRTTQFCNTYNGHLNDWKLEYDFLRKLGLASASTVAPTPPTPIAESPEVARLENGIPDGKRLLFFAAPINWGAQVSGTPFIQRNKHSHLNHRTTATRTMRFILVALPFAFIGAVAAATIKFDVVFEEGEFSALKCAERGELCTFDSNCCSKMCASLRSGGKRCIEVPPRNQLWEQDPMDRK
ncbi:hypothetical protein MVEN_01599400 [Mycena venus]|uniref:Uncharacterized protein n=1 Tax=Mycena venus TaxID=2733690 RepID=A0A8H6XSS6_9AGAR|nr:hypothetical protein MVEN_01599400 [Mycena venus]